MRHHAGVFSRVKHAWWVAGEAWEQLPAVPDTPGAPVLVLQVVTVCVQRRACFDATEWYTPPTTLLKCWDSQRVFSVGLWRSWNTRTRLFAQPTLYYRSYGE